MIKKILYISLILLLFNFTVNAQNVECIDNLINIPLAGYKAGNIQWQFSTDQTNWTDIENQNSVSLSYHIQETGYFRAEIIDLACTYYSDTVFVQAFPYPTVANAGPDQSYVDGTTSVTLAANIPEADHGTGYWSIISGEGGSFVDSTDAGTVFNGKLFEIYSLKWNIITECQRSEDDVKISFIDFLGDFDGNKYKTVVIGDQIWMAENLKVTHYDNGTPIHLENYSNANIDLYGIYYKPLVGLNNSESSFSYPSGVQGVCPSNWHIPSPSEWEELINYTGNNAQVLKSTTGWSGDNNGLDTYSFSILPAGKGFISGEIIFEGQEASILTTRYEYGSIYIIFLSSDYDERIDITMDIMDDVGVSIRCVKD